MRRFALLTALVAVSAACTPVRTTLPPPYPVDGRTFHTTEQLAEYAEGRCREASGGELPPNRFTTDGCSVWPDGRKKPDEGWLTCCISHDVAYWCGAGIRRDADQAFRACLRERSSAANANVMYTGVRLGGGRHVPFPWRFGYGHPWPRRRTAVQSESAAQTPPTGH